MSGNRERKRLWLAIILSLFVHVVVAFSLAAYNTIFAPTPFVEEPPAELTIMDLNAVAAPSPPANPPYMETDPAKESAEEPTEKTFESNANAIAASKVPAAGEAPLPTQEGRDLPFIDLQTQQSSLAVEGTRPQPKPEAIPEPTVTPSPTPEPPQKSTPAPTATPEPIATPEPEQFAMLTATPPPALRDPDEAEATPTPEVAPSLPEVLPRPVPDSPASAYQPQQEETRISGRITNRGASSVDAVATPLGKYKKLVSDAIGSRWYYYVKARGDLASVGTAQVEADVDPQGKVQNLRVRSNSANEAFANICLQSFQEAQIPPIPPDLVATLPDGRLSLDFSFTYF